MDQEESTATKPGFQPEEPKAPEISSVSPTEVPPTPLPETQAKTFIAKQQSSFIMEEEGGGLSKLKGFLPVVLILLFLLIGAFAVFKFLLPKMAKPKEVSLTYWGLWEPEQVYSSVISDYQKTHPNVKIDYVFQSPKDYRERLASAIASDKGPDIFRFHSSWVPMFKNDLASVPAKTMDAASFEATFYPVARQDLRVGNSYVGIPLEIDTLALFINEEIFETAGKTPPTTWDELRKTAIELTTKDSEGKIQISGAALGRTENVDHWSDILALMMLQNGADLTNPTGTLAEDALAFFTIFSKIDRVWDETLPSSTAAFAGGKVAMYFGSSWEVFEIKKANPTLKFRVLPVPQLEGTNITWASYWVEGVAKKSKFQDESFEFLKYLSERETLQKLFQAESQLRLFGEPYSRADMANLLSDDDFAGAFIKQAPVARSWYLCSRTFDNGINDKMIKYFEDAVNSVNEGKTAKEALETTASGVSQILAQYGISASVVR